MSPVSRLLPLVLLLVLSACGQQEETSASPNTLRPVRYQKIGYAEQIASQTYSGLAQADQQSRLSFRVNGTIRSLAVKLGDRVRRGQLIATIDPSDYAIQAEQAKASEKGAEANLQSAETQLINARSNYQRIEKLYENNSVSLSDFEQAKSSFEGAQSSYDAALSQVTSAQTQSQSAQNQVSYTRMVAPFSGIITAVNVEVNELVASGNPIAELSSVSQPEVRVGIPENYISSIKKGQRAEIQFSVLDGQQFTGTVQEVSYAAGNSPTYPAIIRIDKPSPDIRPGMAATVAFRGQSKTERVLICPVKALGKDMTSTFVYLLQPGDGEGYVAKRRGVEVGELRDQGFVVRSGLEAGQLVATAGLKTILDGMEVKLME
ncbi:MAG: efflux RND transporter periplasmic adaptor subunit [Bacteroidota bacterium]